MKPENPEAPECTLLSPSLCTIFHKDSLTIILSIWTALQLVWVTMLLVTQLVQIARNLTTYESLKGHLHGGTPVDALNTFVTTGDLSQDIADGGAGPAASGPTPAPKKSLWQQWKSLLGLDTFFTLAFQGSAAHRQQRAGGARRGNPWSRGVVTNCKDFFCDDSPVFKRRENGYAKLGGERVDYTRLYEVPRMRYRSGGGESGWYEAVGGEEEGV